MGDFIKLSCAKCGLDEELTFGIGEDAYLSNYYCKDCNSISSFWVTHNFGDPDFDFDEHNKSYAEAGKNKTDDSKSCTLCKGHNLVKIDGTPKSPCPKCGSKKMKTTTTGDWD
jgi:hypothetical protein